MEKAKNLLLAIVVCMMMVSCEELFGTEDNNSTQTDPVAWLSEIPGVSDVQKWVKNADTSIPKTIYSFNFEQLIDHQNPAKGTFKQRVVLTYNDPTATNILLTEGYAIDNEPDSIAESGLSEMIKTNEINVEYRYFGSSLPEAFDNLDFTYLNSEQASDDLHAIVTALKQSGRFPQKWIATGVSKSGITSALYAYYSEKKGYNDIDLYVPFCAPFCEKIADTRLGQYLETTSLDHDPVAKARYEAYVKSFFTNNNLSYYLNQKMKVNNPQWLTEVKTNNPTMTDDDIYWFVVNYYAVQNQHYQFVRAAYVPINQWANIIPSATASTAEELEWAYKFISLDDKGLLKVLEEMPTAGTRVAMTDEERTWLLTRREQDHSMPYDVQAMFELGHYELTYGFLGETPGAIPTYLKTFEDQEHLEYYYKMYNGLYDNTMTKDFINNFLPNTTKKMIFIYGSQDPWTGGAIPNPTNPNVKKIIIPGGAHNDFIFSPDYCPVESRDMIMTQINEFLQ